MNEDLLKEIEAAKQSGKKVGLVQGSWDLFHLGHLRYLKKARELCDFLVVAMDSDEKIRLRKGSGRPVIPEEERYDFISLLGIADSVVIKPANEPKWNLIKTIKPDVLIAIKENYNDEQIKELEKICGKVAILPRQSQSSTSDKIRKIIISGNVKNGKEIAGKVDAKIEETKKRIGYNPKWIEPFPELIEFMHDSTDWVCPVSSCCYWHDKWYFGSNHTDFNIPDYDIEKRTELYYSTVEHAEMNLLKKLGNVSSLDTPIYTTLFPCDKCMKVLIDKGVKEIIYIEDHPERNWSKRSHELAKKAGIILKQVVGINKQAASLDTEKEVLDMQGFKYIYPPNARKQEQLNIMLDMEEKDRDPLSAEYIEQNILYTTNYWYVSENRFPYEGVEQQYLIVAKNPVYRKEDISKEMWLDLQNIWNDLTMNGALEGGALCFRFGNPAYSGASLKRLHCHLIIPKENTKVKFNIGGKSSLKEGLTLERRKDQDGKTSL